MKKEIGKWLMDIAKYLTTAILLSSLFSDIKSWPWYFYLLMVCSIISVLYGGLVLMEPPKEKNRNKHQSKRKKQHYGWSNYYGLDGGFHRHRGGCLLPFRRQAQRKGRARLNPKRFQSVILLLVIEKMKLVEFLTKRIDNMGAIAVYIFVLLVANVAGLYYYFDDKRKEKEEQD